MKPTEVDYADVQGLVRFGYKRMTMAAYVLVRVKNAEAARSWLHSARVSNAEAANPPPKTALQIAFTALGLRAIGVSEAVTAGFSHEFRAGMAAQSRARQLGDVGNNSPEHWEWGGAAREPHLVIMLFGEPADYPAFVESTKGNAWSHAFEELATLDTGNLDQDEPFGFADGVSQPKLDWEQQRKTPCTQLDYTNEVALGEFLLGYRNEYGITAERPVLDADDLSAGLLNAAEAPGKKDLGRNGTYLVMRQLDQDARKFWQFLSQQSGGDATETERLAAAMVGRSKSGDPLVPLQEKAIPGIAGDQVPKNQFTFDQDPAGARCPFGAHVRRANPRNTDFPWRSSWVARLVTMLGFGPGGFRDDLMSSVRFHRILRRGREYGSELKPEDALAPAPPDEAKRGLHFICLNANISRQFEFLQNAWINSTKFSGLTEESDPLLGNREAIAGCPVTGNFTVQKDGGLRRRVSGLPQFVTVRGGAYFFLPSLRALRYFAGGGSKQEQPLV